MFNECQKNFTQRLGDLGPGRTTAQTQKLGSQKLKQTGRAEKCDNFWVALP